MAKILRLAESAGALARRLRARAPAEAVGSHGWAELEAERARLRRRRIALQVVCFVGIVVTTFLTIKFGAP